MIVTPAFNAAAHIARCVKNVATQCYPHLEHLVVDGGSQDATVSILTQLSETNPQLRWISETDAGQADAMNKGRELAHGAMLGVLNVDDYYEPGAIGKVMTLLDDQPDVDMFVAQCNVRKPDGTLLYVNKPTRLSLDAFLMGSPHPVNPCAYFYRTQVHDRAGGFDLTDHYSLDVDFLYRAVECCKVAYIPELWGNFVKWPEAKTSRDKASNTASSRLRNLQLRHLRGLSKTRQVRITISRALFVGARKLINTLRFPKKSLRNFLLKLRQLPSS